MDYQFIQIEKRDQAGFLTLNDVKKRNAFSIDLTMELQRGLAELRYDPEVRVIVLRGAGGNFCGGGDISAMADKQERLKKGIPLREDPRKNLDRLVDIIQTIRNCEKPVVAWLEGAVAGAGMSIAMACDFSFAAEDCKMLFAFVKLGLVPDMGATFLLTRRVGAARATELFMTGKTFSGRDAADWGIVTRALPAEDLEPAVLKQVKTLANGPALAYDKMKKLINRVIYADMANSMSNEMECQMMLNQSQDHLGAIAAFMEKRAPVFCGK